jgi:sugar lactone lactonase YvrE
MNWNRMKIVLAATLVLAGAGVYTRGFAQQTDTPTNDAPNPYKTIEGWAKLPEGRKWGSTSAVDIDKDGKSIWVGERCGANSCWDRAKGEMNPVDTILKFDETGKLVKSFGGGMLVFPHGIWVGKDGNIWVTDGQDNGTPAGRGSGARPGPGAGATKGHQVFKFSPDGKLLMTLGKAGGGVDNEYFYQPNDVIEAPNGDIFVCEGHSSQATSNARIFKFDKTGKLIKIFGKFGKGPGEFDQPHALAFDSKGRLFIGDRGNNRVVVVDQEGTFISEHRQWSRPSGIFIDKNDVLFSADSESGSVNPPHGEWKRGIRWGKISDGKIIGFIPDPAEKPPSTSAAEGVAVDAKGNIYGAEVGPRALKRYEKQ